MDELTFSNFKDISPITAATAYIVIVMLGAHIGRIAVGRFVSQQTWLYSFSIQFIGTLQICAGFFEEPVAMKSDYLCLFCITCCNIFALHLLRNNEIPSLFVQLEDVVFNRRTFRTANVACINAIAQMVGAFGSSTIAYYAWKNTAKLFDVHEEMLKSELCPSKINIQDDPTIPLITQFAVAMIMRSLLNSRMISRCSALTPLIYSIYYTFARSIVGFPGFEPVFSFARLRHCNLKMDNFSSLFLVYGVSPIAGWLVSRYLSDVLNRIRRERAPAEIAKEEKRVKRRDEHPKIVAELKEAGDATEERHRMGQRYVPINENRSHSKSQNRNKSRKQYNHQGRNNKKS